MQVIILYYLFLKNISAAYLKDIFIGLKDSRVLNHMSKFTSGWFKKRYEAGIHIREKCTRCGKRNHSAENCTETVKCCYCDESGHFVKDCPRFITLVKCKECNKDHYTHQCPETQIVIGQKIPIYIVPDDIDEDERFVDEDWKRTDWVFVIVDIRDIEMIDEEGNISKERVVDVKWPNGHIDKDIPIQNMYGHFARIPRSLIAHYTEEYHSSDEESEEDDNITYQEKLTQVLAVLQFFAEQGEKLAQKATEDDTPTITVEETTEEIATLGKDTEPQQVTISEADSLEFPNLKPETITALREAAVKEDEKKLQAKATKKAKYTRDTQAPDELDKPIFRKNLPTKDLLLEWFKQPSKGGLNVNQLRREAGKMGVRNPKKLRKPELKNEMFKLVNDKELIS